MSQLLVAMQARPASRLLSQVDMLLERIRGSDAATLAPEQCKNILLGFSDCLDDLYRVRPFERFWVTGPWDRAERLIMPLLTRLDGPSRAAAIDTMFAGQALSWLTNLFRHETFAHGRYGDRPKPAGERYLDEAELNRVTAAMLARYRAMSLDAILEAISPIDILFAWTQGGDEGEQEYFAAFLAAEIADDHRFLRVLDALRTTVTTSDGNFKTLKPDNLKPFVDPATVENRLRALAGDVDRPAIAQHARSLIEAVEAARDY